ncbi:hypothetical protein ARZXY2_4610 (plasmid) [Arthrobacter sp. ZXY-2]|nr:hypothetical protein ARZXY2_4610 [Arthrobacter sp. ZXY-2]
MRSGCTLGPNLHRNRHIGAPAAASFDGAIRVEDPGPSPVRAGAGAGDLARVFRRGRPSGSSSGPRQLDC